MMEPAITYLLSGYNELAAEVARLEAELIQTRKDTLRFLDEMRAHHKAEISLVQGFAREERAAHAEGLIMERDELSRVRAEAAEAEVARLRALINRKNQDYDEVLNDYEEMRAAWEAAQADNAALMDWREYALSVGEAIADTGPEGYYDMPPAAWWEFALKRVAALRAQLAARADDGVTAP